MAESVKQTDNSDSDITIDGPFLACTKINTIFSQNSYLLALRGEADLDLDLDFDFEGERDLDFDLDLDLDRALQIKNKLRLTSKYCPLKYLTDKF